MKDTMMKPIFFLLCFSHLLFAKDADILAINHTIKNRMIEGKTYKNGCPIPLKNLRYLRIKYLDFKGKTRIGEMIVHTEVANDVIDIFRELYTIGYPIHKMHLVSEYHGSDWQSIEADNTSAFNCRPATGSKKWSKHSYGKAIDINPIENPYVFRSGKSSHKASTKYIKRRSNHPAVALKNSKIVQIFKNHGWKWGGDWNGAKDYQHFYK